MKRAVLVNGIPGSGKSATARAVSQRFGWPILALDTIKEPFFTELGVGDRTYNRKLGRAAIAAIFDTISGFPVRSTAIVDAWFGFQPPELLQDHLRRAKIGMAVEIWCHAPTDVITRRYANRVPTRSEGHPGLDYLPELRALAARAKPFGGGPLLEIDSTRPLDMAAIDRFLKEAGFRA